MEHPATNLLRGAALALFLPFAGGAAVAEQAYADATGRVVTIPDVPERVFAAGPPASVLLYALKPEAMIGWVRAPRDGDLPFLREEVRDLPTLGRLTGRGDTVDLEVLPSRPDLIVDYGTVSDTYADLASRVQDETGVPYVLIDGSFEHMADGLRRAGAMLGVPERGEDLARYAEARLAWIDGLLTRVPAEDRPRVYLARGPEGLETPAPGSINAEMIERVGAVNAVGVETSGIAAVTVEQVRAWAPDVIITIDPDFAANVGTMPEWQGIPAVADGRVHLSPSEPFGYIDRPPSVNRLAGLIWLAHRLYPEAAEGDLVSELGDFHELFYGLRPDDATLAVLLGE